MTCIGYCLSIRVGIEVFQPQVYANNFPSIFVLNFSFNINTKLSIISIGSFDYSYPFYLTDLIEVSKDSGNGEMTEKLFP